MEKNLEKIYSDIDSFLKDVSIFLQKNIQACPDDKSDASILIDRSKHLLQELSKLRVCIDTMDYVDMTNSERTPPPIPPPKNIPKRNKGEYKERLPQPVKPVDSKPLEKKCPFTALPAREASKNIKFGIMSLERKVFSIIKYSNKIYASIHDAWLLLYWTSKDMKPFCVFDLKEYKATEDESDFKPVQHEISSQHVLKARSSSFKVFHVNSSEKRSYNFTASTHKDMLQWIVNINKYHDVCKNVEEDYVVVKSSPSESYEDNIYDEIPKLESLNAQDANCFKMNPPALPKKSPNLLTSAKETSTICSGILPDGTSVTGVDSEEECDYDYYVIDIKPIQTDTQQNKEICPSPTCNIDEDDEEDSIYDNNIILHPSQLPNIFNENVNSSKLCQMNSIEEPASKNHEKKEKQTNINTTPKLKKQDSKLLSPKPWMPFKKNVNSQKEKNSSKTKSDNDDCSTKTSSQIQIQESYRKLSEEFNSIRETPSNKAQPSSSIVNSIKKFSKGENVSKSVALQHKTINKTVENSNAKNISKNDETRGILLSNKQKIPLFEMSVSQESISSDDTTYEQLNISETPIPLVHKSTENPPQNLLHGTSELKIIRRKKSNSEPPNTLGTFSRNSKLETFQASPVQSSPAPAMDFYKSQNKNLNSSILTIGTKCRKKDEVPIVLMKEFSKEQTKSKKKSDNDIF